MVVRIQIDVPDQPARRAHRVGEFLQLGRGVQVVVPVLCVGVLPPGRGVAAVETHVVEAGDVRQEVLPDREPELWFVDLDPGGLELIEEVKRFTEPIAPAPVPKGL